MSVDLQTIRREIKKAIREFSLANQAGVPPTPPPPAFTALPDTPSNYTGFKNFVTSVKPDELGLEFTLPGWVDTESKPTGLADGGELNVDSNEDLEVAAGVGLIFDSYTVPDARAVLTFLSWPTVNTPITAAPATAGSVVFITIEEGVGAGPILGTALGEVVQRSTEPTPQQVRDEIFLGFIIHNGTAWTEVSSPIVINSVAHTVDDFLNTVAGPTFILSGLGMTENDPFQLDQAAGIVWELNRNWHVNKKDPHRETIGDTVEIDWQYVTSDFLDFTGPTNTVDPDTYEDSPGSTGPVTNGVTIQRVFMDPADNIWVLWGQFDYAGWSEAIESISEDDAGTVIPSQMQRMIFLGYIISEKGTTAWGDDKAAFFAPADISGGGGGGGGIDSFLELIDTPGAYVANAVQFANAAANALTMEASLIYLNTLGTAQFHVGDFSANTIAKYQLNTTLGSASWTLTGANAVFSIPGTLDLVSSGSAFLQLDGVAVQNKGIFNPNDEDQDWEFHDNAGNTILHRGSDHAWVYNIRSGEAAHWLMQGTDTVPDTNPTYFEIDLNLTGVKAVSGSLFKITFDDDRTADTSDIVQMMNFEADMTGTYNSTQTLWAQRYRLSASGNHTGSAILYAEAFEGTYGPVYNIGASRSTTLYGTSIDHDHFPRNVGVGVLTANTFGFSFETAFSARIPASDVGPDVDVIKGFNFSPSMTALSGTQTAYGFFYDPTWSSLDNTYILWANRDDIVLAADNSGIVFGAGQDVRLEWDGTNLLADLGTIGALHVKSAPTTDIFNGLILEATTAQNIGLFFKGSADANYVGWGFHKADTSGFRCFRGTSGDPAVGVRMTIYNTAVDIPEFLRHAGNSPTFLRFTTDQIELTAGNFPFIKMTEDVVSELTFNDGLNNIDIIAKYTGGVATIVRGSSGRFETFSSRKVRIEQKGSNYTLHSGTGEDHYIEAAGNNTQTLPPAPLKGDTVTIINSAFTTTIGRNGKNINGVAADDTITGREWWVGIYSGSEWLAAKLTAA